MSIGASTDTTHVHLAWRKSDPDLAAADFPWIADNGAMLASALGILDKDEPVAFRATFIVRPVARLRARHRVQAAGRCGGSRDRAETVARGGHRGARGGCGMCIDSHEQVLKKAGATAEAIQTAVRIGAVLKAVATVHAALN